MNTDKIAEWATLILFVLIGLVVFALTAAVTFKLVLRIIGG